VSQAFIWSGRPGFIYGQAGSVWQVQQRSFGRSFRWAARIASDLSLDGKTDGLTLAGTAAPADRRATRRHECVGDFDATDKHKQSASRKKRQSLPINLVCPHVSCHHQLITHSIHVSLAFQPSPNVRNTVTQKDVARPWPLLPSESPSGKARHGPARQAKAVNTKNPKQSKATQ
jgi:hypothetical protein